MSPVVRCRTKTSSKLHRFGRDHKTLCGHIWVEEVVIDNSSKVAYEMCWACERVKSFEGVGKGPWGGRGPVAKRMRA